MFVESPLRLKSYFPLRIYSVPIFMNKTMSLKISDLMSQWDKKIIEKI